MAANIWIIPGLKIWQFSCLATTSFIILYHEQPTFGWFSCKNHSRFKVDNFPGWLWVMIFVWQISCMAVNFFWQISGMAVRSEIRLTIFLFFVLKLVDNFTIWQNYRNPFLATKIHFFCRLSVMTPTMRSWKVNLVYIVPWQRFSYHLSNL